jgi:hypothetical protein
MTITILLNHLAFSTMIYNEDIVRISHDQGSTKHMRPLSYVYIFILGSIASAYLYYLTAVPGLPQSSRVVVANSPCGLSPTEARTNGCHFDAIHYAWLPSICANQHLETEFLPIQDVVLHADAQLYNAAISDEDFGGGDVRAIVTTNGFVAKRCQYAWEKLRRTVTEGSIPDSRIWTVANMDDCAEILADFPKNWQSRNQSDVRVEMEFLSCVEQ